MRHLRLAVLNLAAAAAAAAAACGSPEAARTRGGGPGADPGNRGRPVRMHDGSEPYHATPCLLPKTGCEEPTAAPGA
jgi:hypothetical protein